MALLNVMIRIMKRNHSNVATITYSTTVKWSGFLDTDDI